jgi:hypothetical protein
MLASRLLQTYYDKSEDLTERQNSSNLFIEAHTQDPHAWQKFANDVLARTRAESHASLTKSKILDYNFIHDHNGHR